MLTSLKILIVGHSKETIGSLQQVLHGLENVKSASVFKKDV